MAVTTWSPLLADDDGESVAPTDSPAPAAIFVVNLTESVSLLDDYLSDLIPGGGGGTTYNETLAEAFTALDSYSADAIYGNDIAEFILTAESLGATTVYVSTVGETITLAATVVGALSGVAVWPDPAQVLLGVVYGPTGAEYTGTAVGGGMVWLRRR